MPGPLRKEGDDISPRGRRTRSRTALCFSSLRGPVRVSAKVRHPFLQGRRSHFLTCIDRSFPFLRLSPPLPFTAVNDAHQPRKHPIGRPTSPHLSSSSATSPVHSSRPPRGPRNLGLSAHPVQIAINTKPPRARTTPPLICNPSRLISCLADRDPPGGLIPSRRPPPPAQPNLSGQATKTRHV